MLYQIQATPGLRRVKDDHDESSCIEYKLAQGVVNTNEDRSSCIEYKLARGVVNTNEGSSSCIEYKLAGIDDGGS